MLELMRVFQIKNWLMKSKGSFKVGEWLVEPSLDRITRSGESCHLQPQIMEVLIYLARRAGSVVSAEEITSDVWGARVVTASSIYVTLNQLRVALGDDARDPRYIETVPKKGYRLTAEVVGLDEAFPAQGLNGAPLFGKTSSKVLAGALLVFLVFLVAVTWQQMSTSVPESNENQALSLPPSVAVLPFADMSLQQNQQWFADGISEEIINLLAQIPGLKVTGRTSSFAFRGPQSSTRQVGEALRVAHLLEGSIRTDGDQVRVTAQLLRAHDGFHIWSENFDGDASRILDIQDQIAVNIARTLQPQLAGAETAQENNSVRPFYPSYSAYELYLKALEQINNNTRQSLTAAQELLERALDLEPDYVDAHVALVNVYRKNIWVGNYDSAPFESFVRVATPHVERALEIDPDHAGANAAHGDVLLRQDDKRLRAYEKALSLNPNFHHVHRELGVLKLDELVSWRETLPHLERAAEIEPLDVETAQVLILFMEQVPHRWEEAETMLDTLVQSHPDRADVQERRGVWLLMVRGRPSLAVPVFEQALLLDPDRVLVKVFLAMCWYMVGEYERARELPFQNMQWASVLALDREKALAKVKATEEWGEITDYGRRLLVAYTLVLLRDFQAAVDVLAQDSGDLDKFTQIYAQQFGMHDDPGMSLATAHWALGNQVEYKKWAEFARKAINIRTENGRLHNFEYSIATARLDAMEGRHYDAALELEWFVKNGPLDIRELMYPAYDGMRDEPRFRDLQRMQLERVNAERRELGLDEHPDYSAMVNYVDQELSLPSD
jgi:TolB-like protein/DNA-binding winged helix-turn-helix (wHTH) protein/Flp pilus assembly protein TadD